MSEPKSPQITIENALMGLALTQTFFESGPEAEDIFEGITDSHDDEELLVIYAQLASMWAITEAQRQNMSVSDYMRVLRQRMLAASAVLKREMQGYP